MFSEQIVQFNLQYYVFYTLLKFVWYIFYLKNIYTARSHTWRHSNTAVQQAVPLIATHINYKALIMINKN